MKDVAGVCFVGTTFPLFYDTRFSFTANISPYYIIVKVPCDQAKLTQNLKLSIKLRPFILSKREVSLVFHPLCLSLNFKFTCICISFIQKKKKKMKLYKKNSYSIIMHYLTTRYFFIKAIISQSSQQKIRWYNFFDKRYDSIIIITKNSITTFLWIEFTIFLKLKKKSQGSLQQTATFTWWVVTMSPINTMQHLKKLTQCFAGPKSSIH